MSPLASFSREAGQTCRAEQVVGPPWAIMGAALPSGCCENAMDLCPSLINALETLVGLCSMSSSSAETEGIVSDVTKN